MTILISYFLQDTYRYFLHSKFNRLWKSCLINWPDARLMEKNRYSFYVFSTSYATNRSYNWCYASMACSVSAGRHPTIVMKVLSVTSLTQRAVQDFPEVSYFFNSGNLIFPVQSIILNPLSDWFDQQFSNIRFSFPI